VFSPCLYRPLWADTSSRSGGAPPTAVPSAQEDLPPASCGGGEACICGLTEPVALSQRTVSHHMKVLVGAGLLTRDQRGKWAYYRLVPGSMDSLAKMLSLAVPAGV
jgi:DNA-binding transcriptional ArsR family regulator